MSELDEKEAALELEVLNCLFFIEPFSAILEETKLERPIAGDILKKLIRKKWVTPMVYDEVSKDYVRSYIYDGDRLDTYYYLATKEGLMHCHGYS